MSGLGENDQLDPAVPLHCLRLDGGTQSRAAMDDAAIAEYTEAIRQGATLPPLIAYFDGVDFWLADGFHRYHAYHAAGVEEVLAEVRTGSKRDAVLYSVGANASHGLRRTNADKRRAVETLLADAEWAAWSDREIARRCCVHHDMVAVARKSLADSASEKPTERTYTTKHGTTATMNTASIGRGSVERSAPKPTVAAPMTDAPEAIPAPADTPSDTPIDIADAGELAALREENTELKALLAETLADNEMMGRVFDADDKVKASMDEARRQKALADNAERTLAAKSHEFVERARNVTYWKNRAEKAERMLAKAA